MSVSRAADPFAALGLPARAGLGDDEVRAAWRRIAAATHPDRADGGDPARFAAAASAYTTLRTQFGRSEALADLAGSNGPAGPSVPAGAGRSRGRGAQQRWRRATARLARLPARIRHGRPLLLALRAAAVAAVSAIVVAVAGPAPAAPALIIGALTWLLLTARHDLAPPPLTGRSGQRPGQAGRE